MGNKILFVIFHDLRDTNIKQVETRQIDIGRIEANKWMKSFKEEA